MFDSEKVITEVFSACEKVFNKHSKFNATQVIESLNLPEALTDKDKYRQKKSVTNAPNILEKSGFISGVIEPEYTSNLRLLKEVRYGEISTKGRIFAKLPVCVQIFILFLVLQKNKIISLLGVLSFAKLTHNAYLGLGILTDWLGYVAAAIVLYILYLLIIRTLDSSS